MAGLCAPLSTLRQYPHGYWRMTRGRCGSLLLHRDGLAPSTPCRSPGALRFTPDERTSSEPVGMPQRCQKRKCPDSRGTSVLPSGADIVSLPRHVRLVPKGDPPPRSASPIAYQQTSRRGQITRPGARAHALLELRGAGDEVEVRLVLVRVVHLRVRVSAPALHRAREAVTGDRLFSERLAVLNDLDGRAGLEVREVERRLSRLRLIDGDARVRVRRHPRLARMHRGLDRIAIRATAAVDHRERAHLVLVVGPVIVHARDHRGEEAAIIEVVLGPLEHALDIARAEAALVPDLDHVERLSLIFGQGVRERLRGRYLGWSVDVRKLRVMKREQAACFDD